jgi:hypothetical protein
MIRTGELTSFRNCIFCVLNLVHSSPSSCYPLDHFKKTERYLASVWGVNETRGMAV